jgi:hypothetical protein
VSVFFSSSFMFLLSGFLCRPTSHLLPRPLIIHIGF